MDSKNWILKFNEYINDNASFVIINRSVSYNPEMVDQKENDFTFICKGTRKQPYEIDVGIDYKGEVYSSCSCPYSGDGICKHQVAAINNTMLQIKNSKVKITENIIPTNTKSSSNITTSSTTIIPCHQGEIYVKDLEKINFTDRGFYLGPAEITKLSQNKIQGGYDDFRDYFNLTLTYDPKKDVAKLECSCKSKRPCFHKLSFLKAISKRISLTYFSPDFELGLKNKILEEKNLIGKVDFDDVFTLKVTPDGISFDEKLANVIAIEDQPLQLFTNDRKEFFLPSKEKKNENLALGWCLEFYDKKLQELYAFSGKLNKSKTEISTKLRKIDLESWSSNKSRNYSDEEIDFVFNALRVTETYEDIIDDPLTPESFKSLGEDLLLLEPFLKEKPLFLYDSKKSFVKRNVREIHYNESKPEPILKITDSKKFYRLEFMLRIENKTYKIPDKEIYVTPIGIVMKDQLYFYANAEEGMHLMYADQKGEMNIVNNGPEHFRKNVIQPFSNIFEIDYNEIQPHRQKKKQKANQPEKHIYLTDEEGEYIVLQPLMKYGEHFAKPGSKEKIWAEKDGLTYLTRNEKEELNFLNFVKDLHPDFQYRTEFFYLTAEQALESLWLMDAIEKMQNEGISVFGMNNLKSIRYNLNKPTFSMNLSSGTDWFDMKIDVQYGDQKVDLKSLQKAIVKKSNYVELKDGTLGLLPKEWIEKYKKYFQFGQVKKDKIEVSNYQFNIIDELYEELTTKPSFLMELHEKKKRLEQLSEMEKIPKPKHLKADLRPYQQDGLNWLGFLHKNSLGGCLADDMGLGKTIQTIAFLQHYKNTTPAKERKPHLIVAPTSLMFNWQAEIEKFAPQIKSLAFVGAKRDENRPLIVKNDIVLTTYGSLVKDITFHQTQNYAYVVLDESQAIKNPQSQRFKAVRLLQCENRLALTGTPIENNTFDLYSQFNFLNPGIFGSVKNFRTNFSDAIDKEQDEYTSELLSKMIHPFILRRTKKQVATELPDKTEAVIYCEMGDGQRKVYDEFKKYFRQKIIDQIEDEGVNKSQMHILQGLTKLRQICNSTALADHDKDYGNYSAKLDELTRHLKEKVGNHKVLVFSQFVGMLQIVKNRLKKEKINFEYLDGQTKNREEKVNNFQTDDNIRVFLISLKAGGTGLNLTEADYVFLIDPWWNPAVESQAIDRCYRIGQDKKVMAYRMICKDTIEEKIVQLQDKKKTIASEVIRVDKEQKTFKKKDVELLFS